jgi:hypothetical protein
MTIQKIGTLVYLKLGTGEDACVGETSVSFKSAQTMIDISSKASGINSDFEAGRLNRTISVSSIASTDPNATGYSFQAALAAQVTGEEVDFLLTAFSGAGNRLSGDLYIAGKALFSNVAWDAPDNDKMTFSLDMQVTGTLDIDVNDTVAAPTGDQTQDVSAGDLISDLAATGNGIQWYSSASGTFALAASTPLINGGVYYASQTTDGVESQDRLAVTVTFV